mmetsp:Transcript_1465/g.2878  ORF Transcript_1465/g.2878 Transcript_1465/m.2878 type:complete len:125 (+) Transcript_1465:1361-1735(+)
MHTFSNPADGPECHACPSDYNVDIDNFETGHSDIDRLCAFCNSDSCRETIRHTWSVPADANIVNSFVDVTASVPLDSLLIVYILEKPSADLPESTGVNNSVSELYYVSSKQSSDEVLLQKFCVK